MLRMYVFVLNNHKAVHLLTVHLILGAAVGGLLAGV